MLQLPNISNTETRRIKNTFGYCATSDGRIFTCISGGSHKVVNRRWWQIKGCPTIRRNAIQITIAGRRTYLHRVILETFIGPCPPGKEGCHNDGNAFNNCIDNLRWDTRQANVADTMRHGTTARGESSGVTKLTNKKVLDIRKKYCAGTHSQLQLAHIYGISRPQVSMITSGKSWRHLDIFQNRFKKTHKLSNEQKAQIIQIRNSGTSLTVVAKQFNIDRSYVHYLTRKQK